jgi:hypothetical protein
MTNDTEFDRLIGKNNDPFTESDLRVYQRIIKAHSAEQPTEDRQSINHINLRLEMEDYIESDSAEIKIAGAFLEKLLKIYDVKKSQFAAFIDLEKTNLYALLKAGENSTTLSLPKSVKYSVLTLNFGCLLKPKMKLSGISTKQMHLINIIT